PNFDIFDKKNYRLVVDYRALNAVTKSDVFPIPLVQSAIDKLANKKYFSKFDINMAFHQFAIEDQSKDKTTFVTPFGLFKYNVLPMGLKNSPATFQRSITKILNKVKDLGAVAFLDDIIFADSDLLSHVQSLVKFLSLMEQFNIKLKPEKTELFMTEISYLGHVINEHGVKPDPKKVEAILNLRYPENLKELQSLLGSFNYYKEYIPNSSEICIELHKLTRKNVPYIFDDKCENAVNKLKVALAQHTMLGFFDPTKDVEVYTDASEHTISGVLCQRNDKNERRVIRYGSKSLKNHQLNWHINRKEFYAHYYFICEEFKHYCYGVKVIAYCDSESVIKTKAAKKPNLSTIRMNLELEVYNIEMRSIRSSQNYEADCLSRLTPVKCNLNKVFHASRLLHEQQKDKFCNEIVEQLKCEVNKHTEDEFVISNVDDKVILQVVLPKTMILELLKHYHDSLQGGHFNYEITFEKIRLKYYFPKMRTIIKDYCRACKECQLSKPSHQLSPGLNKILHVSKPFQRVNIDIQGPFKTSNRGKRYIVSAVDQFSKYIEMKAIKKQDAVTIAKFIKQHIICRHGPPLYLLSDLGSVFMSEIVTALISINPPTEQQFTSAYHPQTNGNVERSHSVPNDLDWDLFVDDAKYAYNTRMNRTIGKSPFEVIYNRLPYTDFDYNIGNECECDSVFGEKAKQRYAKEIEKVKKRIHDRQKAYVKRCNENLRQKVFKIGDIVKITNFDPIVDSRKLSKYYKGPYISIENPNVKTKRNVQHIELFNLKDSVLDKTEMINAIVMQVIQHNEFQCFYMLMRLTEV
ncbi:Transposon Ty3-G Gag-Pol polyprotein-like protein, partial [Leptotrombidium deliense]